MNRLIIPVVIGLAVGIGVIALFGLSSIPVAKQPDTSQDLPERVWVGRSPTQCAELWDSDEWRLTADGESKDRVAAMTDYLENQGVTIYEMKVIENSEFDGKTLSIFSGDIARCEGCGCTGWNTVFILVPRVNVEEMQNTGFRIYSGDFTEIDATQ